MNYEEAKQAFRENLDLVRDPRTDPLTWNLNAGLTALTSSLEADLRQIASLLEQVLLELRQRPR